LKVHHELVDLRSGSVRRVEQILHTAADIERERRAVFMDAEVGGLARAFPERCLCPNVAVTFDPKASRGHRPVFGVELEAQAHRSADRGDPDFDARPGARLFFTLEADAELARRSLLLRCDVLERRQIDPAAGYIPDIGW
jgi:hypothetical protein